MGDNQYEKHGFAYLPFILMYCSHFQALCPKWEQDEVQEAGCHVYPSNDTNLMVLKPGSCMKMK